MSRIRSKDTLPEKALRKALWKRGLRYRLQYGKERIDIAFPRLKIAVFIDGCFWHVCPLHGFIPKSNQTYWIPKLERNIIRDLRRDEKLARDGWTVFHFWEHEVKNFEAIADLIWNAVSGVCQ